MYSHNLLAKKREKGVIIAVHRGSGGGNIIENTYESFVAAIKQGGGIIEADVSLSTDGIAYLFHDGNERRLLGIETNIKNLSSSEIDECIMRGSHFLTKTDKVQRLIDVLPKLKGDTLINIDRCWEEWNYVMPIVRKFHMESQVIFKSKPTEKYLDYFEQFGQELMYMPIITEADEIEMIAKRKINTVAVELIITDENSPLLDKHFTQKIHTSNMLIWLNAINLGGEGKHNLSAYHDDFTSVMDNPDKGWGWLIEKGADIIQTDWPAILRDYLNGIKK